MGGIGLDAMYCGSFSMICQWSRIDLENCLRSDEYRVTRLGGQIWNWTDLELNATRVEESFGDVASDDF